MRDPNLDGYGCVVPFSSLSRSRIQLAGGTAGKFDAKNGIACEANLFFFLAHTRDDLFPAPDVTSLDPYSLGILPTLCGSHLSTKPTYLCPMTPPQAHIRRVSRAHEIHLPRHSE